MSMDAQKGGHYLNNPELTHWAENAKDVRPGARSCHYRMDGMVRWLPAKSAGSL